MMLLTVPSWLVTIGWEETDRQTSYVGGLGVFLWRIYNSWLEGLSSWLANLLLSGKYARGLTMSTAV